MIFTNLDDVEIAAKYSERLAERVAEKLRLKHGTWTRQQDTGCYGRVSPLVLWGYG